MKMKQTKYILYIFFLPFLSTYGQKAQMEVFVSGVEFKIVKCYGESSTNKVTIECIATNTNEFTNEVRTAGIPKAYDEFGSEVIIINKTGGWLNLFGGTSRMASLSNGIPIRGKILLSQVSKSSRFISILQFDARVSSEGQKRVPPWEKCEFRLIPIEWR